MKQNNIKYIPLYLPQFHTFKENDEWWGKGFTEWTNTEPAVPFFEGHYQPHEPHDDIGYYDLSDVNVMIKQAKMAKDFGIYGFSYYYYWFNGKKLMEKPLENMLNNKEVDIPFCLFWANHNWTRSWDAGNKEILLEQIYDESTNEKFIDDLVPYFKDERYIRIDNKPVLLIYQADHLPNPKQTVIEWRKIAKEKYSLELYLVTVQQNNLLPPQMFGYDAAMETSPNCRTGKSSRFEKEKLPKLPSDVTMTIYDYIKNIFLYILEKEEKYKRFNCVYPMWDNTARRKKKNAWMFLGSTPELFEKFLAEMTLKTILRFEPKEQFLFINAWNEWAEGAHLEPDKKYGYAYLEKCKKIRNMNIDEIRNSCFDKELHKKMNRILNGGFFIRCLKKLNPISKIRIKEQRIIKFLGIPIYTYNKEKNN